MRRRLWPIVFGVAGLGGMVPAASAQTIDRAYAVPPKAVKMTAAAVATVLNAKTVAVVVRDVARVEITSVDPKKKEVRIATGGGIRRGVSADKAKTELIDSLEDWGRFTVIEDAARADLVLVIFEDSVAASGFSQMNGDTKHRLRDRLAVFASGSEDQPLWADEARESTFGALTGSGVGKVVGKFRSDVESAARRSKN